jgi:hypothetical protein
MLHKNPWWRSRVMRRKLPGLVATPAKAGIDVASPLVVVYRFGIREASGFAT